MSSTEQDKHPTETKSLLPQNTRPRNTIHSPRKSHRHHTHTHHHHLSPPPFPDESPPQPQSHHHQHPHRRRCRLLITTLFTLTSLLALLSLTLKFIIFPYLLPTPTPTLHILSLSLSLTSKPNSSTVASVHVSLSNPTFASTFHFSDTAYTLRYNSKPVSETNPNVKLTVLPHRTVEIAYDMLLEKNEETKRGMEEMMYRARRRETVVLDMTVYLYGSSAIRPWSVRMLALFYDCDGIVVDFSAVDGGGMAASGAACQLVEKLTS